MLSYKAAISGLNSMTVAALGQDVSAGLSAAGTTQGTATACPSAVNEFTTVAAGTGAVLYAGIAGDSQIVYNGGANTLTVYPDSGSKINNQATNAGIALAVQTGCQFTKVTSSRWIGLLSA